MCSESQQILSLTVMPARQNNIDPALVTRLLPPEVSLSHKVNAIGLAVIRKCIEVIGVAQLLRELRRLHGLQMRMGTRATEDEYGRIVASYVPRSFLAKPKQNFSSHLPGCHKRTDRYTCSQDPEVYP